MIFLSNFLVKMIAISKMLESRVNCKVCAMWDQELEFRKNTRQNSLEYQKKGLMEFGAMLLLY